MHDEEQRSLFAGLPADGAVGRGRAGPGPGAGEGGAETAPAAVRVKVAICGDDYVVKGQASPLHIRELASMVDEKMRRILGLHPNLVRHRAAVLAAIHLAEDLMELRAERDRLKGELAALTREAR